MTKIQTTRPKFFAGREINPQLFKSQLWINFAFNYVQVDIMNIMIMIMIMIIIITTVLSEKMFSGAAQQNS